MDRQAPKSINRPCFQIHLSTAVVLMILAGFFVWRNLRGNKTRYWLLGDVGPDLTLEEAHKAEEWAGVRRLFGRSRQFGWPFPMMVCVGRVETGENQWLPMEYPASRVWIGSLVLRTFGNAFIALFLLSLIAILIEKTWHVPAKAEDPQSKVN